MSRFVHIIAVSTFAVMAYDVSVWIAAPRNTTESALSSVPILIDGSTRAYGKQASSMPPAREIVPSTNPQTSGQVAKLEAALEEAKHNATAQIQTLQAQLSSEQVKATSLDGHLALARERLAQADRARGAQVGAKDNEAEQQERQQQAVATALDEAKRNATTQLDAVQTQLANEQVKTTSLDDELAHAREQLAQADHDKDALAAAAKDKEADVQAKQQPLAAALDETRRNATAQIQALQSQLASEQAKTANLDGDLTHAREQLAQADQDKAAQASVAKVKEAELQARQQPLVVALEETKRESTAQIQALQARLASEQAKTANLDGDLAHAHEQLAQADHKPAQAAAKVEETEPQAKPLTVALEETKRSATAQIQALQNQLASDWPRERLDEAEADRIARAFLAAFRNRDTTVLASLLATDVEIRSDGDDAYPNMVRGIDRVQRLFARLAGKPSKPTLLQTATVDGLPGYITIDQGGALQTTALDIRDGKIAAVYIVCTPDQLRHVAMTVGPETASAN